MIETLISTILYLFAYWLFAYILKNRNWRSERAKRYIFASFRFLMFVGAIILLYIDIDKEGWPQDFFIRGIDLTPIIVSVVHNLSLFRKFKLPSFWVRKRIFKPIWLLYNLLLYTFAYLLCVFLVMVSTHGDPLGFALGGILVSLVFFILALILTIVQYPTYKIISSSVKGCVFFGPIIISLITPAVLINY